MNRIHSFVYTHSRRFFLASILALIAVPLVVVDACTDPGIPAEFVAHFQTKRPEEFARGQLGLLQSTFYMAEKFVAYRYLIGGTLNAEEQKVWRGNSPEVIDWVRMTPEEREAKQKAIEQEAANTGVARWNSARAAFSPTPVAQVKQERHEFAWERDESGNNFTGSILNCTDSAFDTATNTMKDRAVLWGPMSPDFRDWLLAQDAVFSNCDTVQTMPQSAHTGASRLLQQDRSYQIAAAQFYRGSYDEAASSFAAIAQDKTSPWSRWGTYLMARSLVRKAAQIAQSSAGQSDMARFDKPTLGRAMEILRVLAAQKQDAVISRAAERELGFVLIRYDPRQRSVDLANAIAGPHHDPNYKQDIIDLRFLADNGSVGDAPLLNWMRLTGTTFPYSYPSPGPDAHHEAAALQQWHASPTLPLLVAVLMNARSADSAVLDAASQVPPASPAYITLQYHRARLLFAAGRTVAARALADEVLQTAHAQNDIGATNALLQIRAATAKNFDSMLADLPRQFVQTGDYGCGEIAKCPLAPKEHFDSDGARIFNLRLPLSMWIDAAKSPKLPLNIREGIAIAGWTRAYVLEDESALKQFATMVKPALPQNAGFAATYFVLHSSRLQPYLDAGLQPTWTYAPGRTSLTGGAWWCAKQDSVAEERIGVEQVKNEDTIQSKLTFLTSTERAQAAKEVATLDARYLSIPMIGRRAIDYIRAHPQDGRAPEALARIVLATHYGCSRQDKGPTTAISKEAFQLLHARYGSSEWAKKTKYYY
ncbi:MAG: hypothetical protein JSS87_11020 [Acidobacteria bacterium]|nr:hypothetical protein [Acidobacteriota bacterium]